MRPATPQLGRMSQLISLLRSNKLLTGILAGTLVLDAGYYGLHDFLQRYRAFNAACKKEGSSEALPASDRIRSALAAAANRLGLQPGCLDKLNVFICRSVDPVRLGRLSDARGFQAHLGLPQHFEYQANDAEKRNIFFFDDRALSLNTKKGRELYRDCLLLNDDELGFVLARELAYLNSYATHAPPLAGTLAAAGMFGVTYYLKNTENGRLLCENLLKKLSRGKSVLSFALFAVPYGLLAVMAYQWHSAYRKSLDLRVDRRAAEAYPLGGASFYKKQVRRNVLLYALLGESIGKKYFTMGGNEIGNNVFANPFLPVNQRWSKLKYEQSLAASPAASA